MDLQDKLHGLLRFLERKGSASPALAVGRRPAAAAPIGPARRNKRTHAEQQQGFPLHPADTLGERQIKSRLRSCRIRRYGTRQSRVQKRGTIFNLRSGKQFPLNPQILHVRWDGFSLPKSRPGRLIGKLWVMRDAAICVRYFYFVCFYLNYTATLFMHTCMTRSKTVLLFRDVCP